MPLKDCLADIVKAGQGKFNAAEADEMLTHLEKVREDLKRRGDPELAQALQKYAANAAKAKLTEAQRKRRQKIVNILAARRLLADVDALTTQGLSPFQAFLVAVRGEESARVGSRASVERGRAAFTGEFVGPVVAAIDADPQLATLLRRRAWDGRARPELAEFLARVEREMETATGGAPSPQAVTGDARAKRLADVLTTQLERARVEANRLGADVGQLDGYTPHQHDAWRIARAPAERWLSTIKEELDIPRSFPGATPAQVDNALLWMRDRIIAGDDIDPLAHTLPAGAKPPQNIANLLSRSRSLHFNPGGWERYAREFGGGDVLTASMKKLEETGRAASLMDRLGASPSTVVQAAADELAGRVRNAGGMTAAKKRDIDRLRKIMASPTMRVALGLERGVHSEMAATIGSVARTWEQASKLGGAVLSAGTDPMLNYLSARYRGLPAPQAAWRAFAGIFEGRGKGETRRLAALLNEGFDAFSDRLTSAYADAEAMPGRASAVSNLIFRLQGLAGWTDIGRSVGTRMILREAGEWARKPMDQLRERERNVLQRHGITPAEWDAMRQGGELVDGRRLLTPAAIEGLPDAAVAGALRPGEAAEDAKRRLARVYRGLIADEVSGAILEPGIGTRAITTGGLERGTLTGEGLRAMMLFKSFPIEFTRRVLGRTVFAQPGNARGQRLARTAASVGEMMAVLTAAGLLASWAKDVAAGKSPKELIKDGEINWKTVGAALAQSGGAGIFGDFLFAEQNRVGRGLADTMAGPLVGDVLQGVSLATSLVHGEPRASRAVNLATGLTPNLWYTRAATNALFLNALREWSAPGYLSRQDARMRRDFGQERVLPADIWSGR
jgi:hypothetical protein